MFLFFVGCSQVPARPRGQPIAEATHHEHELRDQVRLILEENCGSCHISSYATAVPKALAVFDLLDEDWSRNMTDAQLASMLVRLSDQPDLPLRPGEDRVGGGGLGSPQPAREVRNPLRVPGELDRARRYVDELRAQRKTPDNG